MSERLLIRGGRVIDPANGLDETADVLLAGGHVASIRRDIDGLGARVVDAAECLVVPGLVDLHAHLREPGFEHKGTIASETLAALRGGFTTVCAMPNTEPAPDSAAVVEALWERIRRDARVNVLPIGCTTRGRHGREIAELSEMADAGVIAFSDDGNPVADAMVMRNALLLAGQLGIPISEHSDDPVLHGAGVMNDGRISERLGLPGEPAAAEVTAISRNIALSESTGAHLHIAHVTTARGVELVADAKARGVRVTAEVTPSHLFLTEDAIFGPGPEPLYDTNARINPPLRTEADRRALLRGVNEGVIDAIATDHAPHAIQDKLCEFDQAAPGISCAETALGTVMTLVERGELDLSAALAALTINPARIFAIDRRLSGTGSLALGVAADVLVIAPAERWTVEPSRFASRGKNTPLAGVELTGAVRAVILHGALAQAVAYA